ncbi:MAG: C40 family peptidase [Tannerellaceae bacterium]|jgi:lipoprotein Spr|nr:C40 family peptidase [Tannerellaceae bacterium]
MKNKQVFVILSFIVVVLLSTSCGTSKRSVPAEMNTPKELSRKFGLPVTTKDNLHLYTEASKWLGVKHKYGGNTKKGVDCSGLVVQIYTEVYGKNLKRSSADMLKYNCKKVSRGRLQEGDLVFFRTGNGKKKIPNHVGIYLKNQHFVHTSSSKGVIVGDLNDPYYLRNWITGGRVK